MNLLKTSTAETFLIASIAAYVLVIGYFLFNLSRIESYMVQLPLALVLAGLGVGYQIAKSAHYKAVRLIGALTISILFAFPLYFFVVITAFGMGTNGQT